MGKPQKKAPAAEARRTSLSLDLGLGISKKPAQKPAQLQAKQLVDSSGGPTIEGLKLHIDSMIQDLFDRIEKNAVAVSHKANEAEAAVHKQAKADHAKTCQVLQDSQAAMDLAAQQHAAATKQVAHVGRTAAAAVQGVAKTAAEGIREAGARIDKDLAALRAKAGLKA